MLSKILKALSLLALIALPSCSVAELKDPVEQLPIDLTQLRVKEGNYRRWVPEMQDKYGFIKDTHCDLLMFSGLLAASKGVYWDPLSARDSDGKWYRRPLAYGNCYPKEAWSEISQDQLLGLAWYLWRGDMPIDKRREIANDLLSYGKKHLWQMGEPKGDLTVMQFWTVATIAELAYRLGGDNDRALRSLFGDEASAKIVYVLGNTGFRASLQVLLGLLRGEMQGGVDADVIKLFEYQAKRFPQSALFQYAYHKYTDGDMTEVVKILMREDLFPSGHLPTARERNNHWLWEHEDWRPADNDKKFSGGDFLFVASFL